MLPPYKRFPAFSFQPFKMNLCAHYQSIAADCRLCQLPFSVQGSPFSGVLCPVLKPRVCGRQYPPVPRHVTAPFNTILERTVDRSPEMGRFSLEVLNISNLYRFERVTRMGHIPL